jgi:hypothetical protein
MAIRGFIGSASESLQLARDIQSALGDQRFIADVWSDCFGPGKIVIDELLRRSREYDFAIFLFTPDDVATMRARQVPVPRDNVVFEAGLFMRSIGRERVLIVVPEESGTHVLSDLQGLTFLTYRAPAEPRDRKARIGALCTSIRNALGELFPAAAEGQAPLDASFDGRLAAFNGAWSGDIVQQTSHDPTRGVSMRASGSFEVRGRRIVGRFRLSGERFRELAGSHALNVVMEGGFRPGSDTIVRFEYRYANLGGALHFGNIAAELDSMGRSVSGRFLGYGPMTGKIVAGDIVLKKSGRWIGRPRVK